MDKLPISLDAAGVVALADLSAVATRTALTGTAGLLDCLVLCPGLHRQQDAPRMNAGEYPICAAMTTGYVFRVENPATVAYLQKTGRAGQLTTLSVSPKSKSQGLAVWVLKQLYDDDGASFFSTACYLGCNVLTVAVLGSLVYLQDWWGLLTVSILILARALNVLVLRRRAVEGWKGQPEDKHKSDLIVLMSQDKWIRIQGDVNDVKAVTSGEWLREPTFFESGITVFATLLVYLDAALAGNGSTEGKLLLLCLLFSSAGLLGLVNEYTSVLKMYGRRIERNGERQTYDRRLDLADQLIKETGTKDWAIRLGMIKGRAISPDGNAPGRPVNTGTDTDRGGRDVSPDGQVIREL